MRREALLIDAFIISRIHPGVTGEMLFFCFISADKKGKKRTP